MKIFYVTNARLPTEKAHGLATVKLCEALAKQGAEVTIFAPRRLNSLREDVYPVRTPPTSIDGAKKHSRWGRHTPILQALTPLEIHKALKPAIEKFRILLNNLSRFFRFVSLTGRSAHSNGVYEYYRAERNFKIFYLPCLDLIWLGFGQRFFFLLQLFSFSIIAASWLFIRYRLFGSLRGAVIFSHDHIPLFFASFFAPRIFYDIHHYPEHTIFYERVLRRAFGIGVQTKWKIEALSRDFGVPQDKIIYWPNGTDVERFDIAVSREEARAKLGLAHEQKIALYTGSLQRWKGVETLIQASEFLFAGTAVYIVGGSSSEIAALQPKAESQKLKAVFAGQRPWAEIPLWLKAADVLVLPNTGREKVSRFYTSPMKLFEYMASGRPIVASDIPSIREIVDERMVFFAAPDDPRSFARAIREVLDNPDEALRRAERARQESQKYTWETRAKKIFGLIRPHPVKPSN